MEPASEKVKQWIDNGRDPRSAHWQAGLEALLEVFAPYLEPGRLVPALSLDASDRQVFDEAQAVIDVSPNVAAVFLPPEAAGKIRPPELAPELERIDQSQPAYKILLQRPGAQPRLACLEISPQAHNPGVDLFQDGALLGTYDFEDRKECMDSLDQILFAHMWEKGKWEASDFRRYTVNWFERVMDTGRGDIAVKTDFSFLHTPSLIKSNPVDVIFTLIVDVFDRRLQETHSPMGRALAEIYALADPQARQTRYSEMAEKIVLQFLSVVKDFELVDFTEFSEKQTDNFKKATSAAIRRIAQKMEAAAPA
ncbi:MAG: hypothetical protein KFF46_09730 [Desulfobacterales bacterium]|nr:hypothetical protein [Desulfobacterales bacterium]